MNEYTRKLLGQVNEFFKELGLGKQVGAIVAALSIAGLIIGLFYWAGAQSYRPLMTNLNAEDAANIVRVLRDKKIPFQLDTTGRNISIPPEYVNDLRMQLAAEGLPQSGTVGYELFDKQTLGTTSFVQKINEKRAREGELMRSINTIKGVMRSRVHLALPQKSTFVEDQKKSTASVILDLQPGMQLSDKQIFGIGNLVARAIEGLDVSDVAIMDSMGKLLSKNNTDSVSAATLAQLEYKQKVERDFEDRVVSILGPVVGEGKVHATVSADLDFAQVSEVQTTYDQDGSAVRSTEKNNQTMNADRPGPTGIAGAASNTPGAPPAVNTGTKTDTNRSNEVVNYDVPQTVKRTTKPTGGVKRISVAVVVDGKQVMEARNPASTDAKAPPTSKVVPWPDEELKKFESLVASAVGVDKKRGDILEIRNMEFARVDFDEANRIISEQEKHEYLRQLLLYGIIGLVVLMFFIFAVRPFIKWMTENTTDTVDNFLPQTVEELEKIQKSGKIQAVEEAIPVIPDSIDPEKVEGEMIREKITSLVDANPQKAALILRDWIHAEAPKKRAEDEKEKEKTA